MMFSKWKRFCQLRLTADWHIIVSLQDMWAEAVWSSRLLLVTFYIFSLGWLWFLVQLGCGRACGGCQYRDGGRQGQRRRGSGPRSQVSEAAVDWWLSMDVLLFIQLRCTSFPLESTNLSHSSPYCSVNSPPISCVSLHSPLNMKS